MDGWIQARLCFALAACIVAILSAVDINLRVIAFETGRIEACQPISSALCCLARTHSTPTKCPLAADTPSLALCWSHCSEKSSRMHHQLWISAVTFSMHNQACNIKMRGWREGERERESIILASNRAAMAHVGGGGKEGIALLPPSSSSLLIALPVITIWKPATDISLCSSMRVFKVSGQPARSR